MIKKKISIILLSIFLLQNIAFANINNLRNNSTNIEYNNVPIHSLIKINDTIEAKTESSNTINFEGTEFETLIIKRGSKFFVKSLQPMDSNTLEGTEIQFETESRLLSQNKLSKILFTGEVIENKPPRRIGRSSSIKLEISKIKVDNISYKTHAIISKFGNKSVYNGVLTGVPIYLTNLSNTANNGTVTMDKVYKSPCEFSCTPVTAIFKPIYYLGAGLLQLADLFIVAPVISLFQPGEEINIPENTPFEIKLDHDIALLKI